jgi:hypothetical protein
VVFASGFLVFGGWFNISNGFLEGVLLLTLYFLVGPFYLRWVTMSPRLFYDKDCSLEQLKGKTVVFIGYGNQGRAQALNLVSYRERIEYPT